MEVFKNKLIEKFDIKINIPEFNQEFDITHGKVKIHGVERPSEKDAALVYARIINKLSELYRVNLERQELNELYEKLKSIEKAI